MKAHSTTFEKTLLLEKVQLKDIFVVLAASVLIPFVLNLIPFNNEVSIGARMLPLYYAPFIAAYLYRAHVSLIPALIAPFLVYLITGTPTFMFPTLATIQLISFVLLVVYLRNVQWLTKFVAPVAFVGAVSFAALLALIIPALVKGSSVSEYWIDTLGNGIIGMVILLMLNISFRKIKDN